MLAERDPLDFDNDDTEPELPGELTAPLLELELELLLEFELLEWELLECELDELELLELELLEEELELPEEPEELPFELLEDPLGPDDWAPSVSIDGSEVSAVAESFSGAGSEEGFFMGFRYVSGCS